MLAKHLQCMFYYTDQRRSFSYEFLDGCFKGELWVGVPEFAAGEAIRDLIGELSGDGLIKGDGTNAWVGDRKIGVL